MENNSEIIVELCILLYIRAEREGEWALHLAAVEKMLPYFFAAGHPNYALYATYYLNDMYGLSEVVTRKFRISCNMQTLHVARNSTGFFNGIWSDMLIETTYMKFGRSPGGLVGVTLKPKSVIIWAYSFHKISTMTKELKEITDTSNREGKHKEEYKGRMKSDRIKIRKKLSGCINPLTETGDKFSDGIVNIESGKVTASSQTNVHNLKQIGEWRSAAQGLQSITAMWVPSAHI